MAWNNFPEPIPIEMRTTSARHMIATPHFVDPNSALGTFLEA